MPIYSHTVQTREYNNVTVTIRISHYIKIIYTLVAYGSCTTSCSFVRSFACSFVHSVSFLMQRDFGFAIIFAVGIADAACVAWVSVLFIHFTYWVCVSNLFQFIFSHFQFSPYISEIAWLHRFITHFRIKCWVNKLDIFFSLPLLRSFRKNAAFEVLCFFFFRFV